MLKLLKSSKSKNSLNESKEILSDQISQSDVLSEHRFQNVSIIEECSEIDGNGAKINIPYNHERVDKFKTEIRSNFITLLTQNNSNEQNSDNGLELSYVTKIFDNDMHENFNSLQLNDEEQSQNVYISAEDKTDGNNNAAAQNENNTSCITSSSVIDNIEACAALMQLLLKYEFKISKQEELDNDAKKMFQMYTKFRLNDEEPFVSYAKWIAYTELYQFHYFNPEIFLKLLNNLILQSKDSSKKKKKKKSLIKLKVPFKSKFSSKKSNDPIIFTLNFPQNFEYEEVLANLFWESTRKLLDCFLNYFHDLYYSSENDDSNCNSEYLEKLFEIIAKIQTLNDMDENVFLQCVKDSLSHGAIEQITKTINYSILNDMSQNIKRLDELINMIVLTKSRMINFDKKFGHIFEKFIKSSFPQFLYPVYDEQLVKLIQPVILQITDMSKRKFKSFNKDDEDVLIKVFELYQKIKIFLNFVTQNFMITEPKLNNFTDWFITGIDSWREASMMTALFRIEKSIEIDKLKPEFENIKYTSSIIDTMQILYSTKNFWEHLQWFDKHKDADLVKEITQDLCDATSSYLNKFIDKVQNSNGNADDDIHKISENLSLIIANYNYGLEKLRNLIDEFVKNKNTNKSDIEDRYQKTEKILNDKIRQLIISTLKPINIKIEKLLAGDAKASKLSENKTYDSLLTNIEDILTALHNNLPNHEFEIAKSILFLEILKDISKLIKNATKKKKSIEYFGGLNQNFEILKQIFNYSDNINEDDEVLLKIKQTENKLDSYNLNTMELIHRYYIERYKMQQMFQENPAKSFGVLTIRCSFNDNILKIDIIKAENLIGGMINRKCDSYVKIYVIPDKSFPTCQDFKTKTQLNNDFPFYDEAVEFTLTKEQKNMKDAIIYFNVKEKYLMGVNGCIAEAFLALEDIPENDENGTSQEINLKMTRLQSDELEILKIIQYKSQIGDREAKEFLTKINRLPVI
ncbi:protein unc-13 homolog 4B-like [Chironomus tepperi]|uniref:protein unc-13 homolog 4B-like n=1 Tax=Chironomus tepperi TaxID=113505 RepID=UPI00391FAFA5